MLKVLLQQESPLIPRVPILWYVFNCAFEWYCTFRLASKSFQSSIHRFNPNEPIEGDGDNLVCWETTTIFYVSSFQYLILCITYSPGKPFRKPLITNGVKALTMFMIKLSCNDAICSLKFCMVSED